ncbi:MAG: DUF1851 domain-containing protein [Chitinophagaceae bacterium]|nr:MAG: DUF1851 domain-containing protein [Chitinophagaceae bacterium]
MTLDYRQFTKDISKIDLEDICSEWQWLLNHQYKPIIVSLSGDMFMTATDGTIHWLDTGIGKLQKVAETEEAFKAALQDIDNIDSWLLASVVLDLLDRGMILKENQVYSYKLLPILNGDFSTDNFEMTDMSVHFSITGQICKQVKDMPDGTPISVAINPFIKSN